MSLIPRTAFLGTVLLALAAAACDKVPLLAPTNSTIRLTTSVGVLPIAGSADIVAVVIESAGTPVQNGTVVSFVSSLGTVEPREARTTNGQVSVRFVAGSQSGKATISAFSGGSKSDNLDILVGAAAAGGVTLRATQTTVPSTGGAVTLIASVVDTGGNPLRGAPVNFSTTAGTLSRSTALTDAAGDASTELTTNVDATVTASLGSGSSAVKGDAKISAKDLPVVKIEIVGGPSANTAEVGIPTVFSFKHENPTASSAIRSVIVDFGDGGSSRSLGPLLGTTTLSYQYARTGFFNVTATATDALGQVGVSTLAVQVNDRFAIPVTVTQSVVAGVATFSASATPRTGTTIRSYEWDFGDGGGASTTGSITSYRYTRTGTFRVRLRVIATNGDQGFSEFDVRITAI
jgi:PKD repeat protein